MMTCPKCKSDNVTITTEQVSANTKKKGCLFGLGRAFLIVCTAGLWLIFGKKKSKTTFQHQTVAICQSCGRKWAVK